MYQSQRSRDRNDTHLSITQFCQIFYIKNKFYDVKTNDARVDGDDDDDNDDDGATRDLRVSRHDEFINMLIC